MNEEERELLDTVFAVLVEVEGDLLEKEVLERQVCDTRARVMSFKMLHDVLGAKGILKDVILNSKDERKEDTDPTITKEELGGENG